MIAVGGQSIKSNQWNKEILVFNEEKISWKTSKLEIPKGFENILSNNEQSDIRMEYNARFTSNDDFDHELFANPTVIVESKENKKSWIFSLKEILETNTDEVRIRNPLILGLYADKFIKYKNDWRLEQQCRGETETMLKTFHNIYGENCCRRLFDINQFAGLLDTKITLKQHMASVVNYIRTYEITVDSFICCIVAHGSGI